MCVRMCVSLHTLHALMWNKLRRTSPRGSLRSTWSEFKASYRLLSVPWSGGRMCLVADGGQGEEDPGQVIKH